MRGFSSIILANTRVRVSSGHLCEAEAPTETTVETRKYAGKLSLGKYFQRSSRQNLPKIRALYFYVNTLYYMFKKFFGFLKMHNYSESFSQAFSKACRSPQTARSLPLHLRNYCAEFYYKLILPHYPLNYKKKFAETQYLRKLSFILLF